MEKEANTTRGNKGPGQPTQPPKVGDKGRQRVQENDASTNTKADTSRWHWEPHTKQKWDKSSSDFGRHSRWEQVPAQAIEPYVRRLRNPRAVQRQFRGFKQHRIAQVTSWNMDLGMKIPWYTVCNPGKFWKILTDAISTGLQQNSNALLTCWWALQETSICRLPLHGHQGVAQHKSLDYYERPFSTGVFLLRAFFELGTLSKS